MSTHVDVAPVCKNNEAEDIGNDCSADQFYDIVTMGCHDKNDAFVTDATVAPYPPPFCYAPDTLRNMVRLGNKLVYPHNQIPITPNDLAMIRNSGSTRKNRSNIWWFPILNALRGYYKDNPVILQNTPMEGAGITVYLELLETFGARENLGTFTDVNVKCDDSGTTGLIMAAQAAIPVAVKSFLSFDADVNGHDDLGNTALHASVRVMANVAAFGDMGRYESDDMSDKYNDKMTEMRYVAALLIDGGANEAAETSSGFTPIMIACGAGSNQVNANRTFRDQINNVLKDLISSQYNGNNTDNNGLTALHHAARHHDEAAMNVLLKEGPALNVNVRDKQGRTALHHACALEYSMFVHVLTNNMPGPKDSHALRVVDVLLNHGADPGIRDYSGVLARDMPYHARVNTTGGDITVPSPILNFYYPSARMSRGQYFLDVRKELYDIL
jgi:ankyrin repeat protein